MVSLEDVRSWPEFSAEVEVVEIIDTMAKGTLVAIGVKKPSGERISISEFPAPSLLVEFAKTLEVGQLCDFPSAIVAFEQVQVGHGVEH